MKTNHRLEFKTSTILTIVSGVGVVVTAVMTARATPKALDLLMDAKFEKSDDLTTAEKIKTALPAYLPSIAVGSATIVCVLGANILSKKSQASIVSAYTLLDQSYRDYQRKLKELYGVEAHEKIQESLAIEKAKDVYISNDYLGMVNCDLYLDKSVGKPVLFYDPISERYFEATVEQVMNAEYHLNRNFAIGGAAILNELYDFLGIAHIPEGDEMGWAPTDEGEFWIEFNHVKSELPDGRTFYIIEMPFAPRVNYDDYY